MQKYLYFFTILLLYLNNLQAQDPEFTQFYANPIYLNPAFAGTANGPRFAVNYRSQYMTINGFETYSASYDQHFDNLGGGIGFQAYYDKAGDGNLGTTVASFMYSYHLNITHNFTIKAALQASLNQKSIDFSKLLFTDMIDNRYGFIRETKEELPSQGVYKIGPFPDFSAGFMGFSKKFYAGVAIHHINEPKQSFLDDDPTSVLPMKFTTHVGMLMPLENTRHPKNFFSPNILFQKQDKFMQFNLGGYYIKDNFISGLWLRQTSVNTDAFIVLLGVKKDPVKFGYSYDITFSDLRTGGKGSHEISLIVELKTVKRPPSIKWRKLICPSF